MRACGLEALFLSYRLPVQPSPPPFRRSLSRAQLVPERQRLHVACGLWQNAILPDGHSVRLAHGPLAGAAASVVCVPYVVLHRALLLMAASSCPLLTLLDLSSCNITDITLFSLAQDAKFLGALVLSHCSGITSAGVRQGWLCCSCSF